MLPFVDEATNIAVTKTDDRRQKLVFSILALCGIGGGLLSAALGMICIIAHAALSADTTFNRLGTALMIAVIPLLLAGSHFMDKLEEARKRH